MSEKEDPLTIAAVPVGTNGWPSFVLEFTVPFVFHTKVYPAGTNPQQAIEADPLDFDAIQRIVHDALIMAKDSNVFAATFGGDVLRVEASYGGRGNRITFAGNGSLPPPFYADEDVSAFMQDAVHLIAGLVKANGISATSLPKDLVTLIGEAERFAEVYDIDLDEPWTDIADIVAEISHSLGLAQSTISPASAG
jgi:hypothetical protein